MIEGKEDTGRTGQNVSPEDRPSSRSKGKWPLLVLVVVVISALGLGYWWFFMWGRVTTDDAYVKADSASISSRISGTVFTLQVENDQPVEEGQTLVELDPRDYQVVVDRWEAVVARLEAEIKAQEITLSLTDSQTQARLETAQAKLQQAKDQERARYHQMEELEKQRLAAKADLANDQREYERAEKLYRQSVISQENRDNVQTAFKRAEASLKAQDAGIDAIKASLAGVQQEITQAEAQLKIALTDREKVDVERHQLESLIAQRNEARAQLEAASLDRSYCTIKAPLTGHIAQKSVQIGDRVQEGQPVMAVVPLHAVYGEANFKETQLEHVRLGQPAIVRADIYPGYTYHGRVVGIGAGTGAAFSLLPPENATGNWIKVVQRVPVRIEFDRPLPADYPLRVGLSLKVTIDYRSQKGGIRSKTNRSESTQGSPSSP